MLNPDPRYLEYGIRVERETPKPVMPPREIDELADPNTTDYRRRELADRHGYDISGMHCSPLDYLEMTWRPS